MRVKIQTQAGYLLKLQMGLPVSALLSHSGRNDNVSSSTDSVPRWTAVILVRNLNLRGILLKMGSFVTGREFKTKHIFKREEETEERNKI